jgi:hypothetical protein
LRAQTATHQPAPTPAPAAAPSTPPPAPESKPPAKPAAKKVWTDEDMSSLTGPTYDATPNQTSSRRNSTRPRGYSGSANGDYYRNQSNSLKARIADIDQKIDNYEALAHGEAPGQGEKQSGVRITDSRADIQALVKQRQTLQKQISDLEDQARHAGIEPGQLR